MKEKVFYKLGAVGHLISYVNDEQYPIKDDARSRWAYLIISKQEAEYFLKGDEKSSDEIAERFLDEYFSLIEQAIAEEEKTINYQTLTNKTMFSNYKNIVLVSSKNYISTKGKFSILQAKGYIYRSKKLQKTAKQTLSLLEVRKAEAKKLLQNEIEKNNGFIIVNRAKLAKAKSAEEPFALISLPYVYNFSKSNNINSALKATIKRDDAICSMIEPYAIEGKWSDVNKQELLEYNMFEKDKQVFFHIQTVDIPDDTIASLTIMDKDLLLDDKITTLNFTIKDNEAFIPIEFEKIKFNILKSLQYEDVFTKFIDETELFEADSKHPPKIMANVELYGIVEIKKLDIKKELAKETYLKTSTQYIKIGTRSLGNLPYPDSMPPIPIPAISKYVTGTEQALDALNLAPIHQQFAFVKNENLGFTTAYKDDNEDKQGDEYGMLKSDSEMTGIKDIKSALSNYAWDIYCCDEESFKEAIYQVINRDKYAASSAIYKMNKTDVRAAKDRESRPGQLIKFTFTKIKFYTPQEGIRYDLLHNNCQDFVSKVIDYYKMLASEAIKKERL